MPLRRSFCPRRGCARDGEFPKEALDFFETKVRPVFLDKCYACHDGSGVKAIKGGFTLDTREGLLKGGESGKPAVVPGKPDESRLIHAVKWVDEKFRMPPKQEHRLAPSRSRTWRSGCRWCTGPTGADGPRRRNSGGRCQKALGVSKADGAGSSGGEADRVGQIAHRCVRAGQARSRRDCRPAPQADKRTLIRRATFDLTGLPPTPEEVAAFEADASPDAFAKVVDRLLASPRYGERWGRHWLDVARYADTKGYVFEEERRYPFAYTYRD